jgi:hypothetical protein
VKQSLKVAVGLLKEKYGATLDTAGFEAWARRHPMPLRFEAVELMFLAWNNGLEYGSTVTPNAEEAISPARKLAEAEARIEKLESALRGLLESAKNFAHAVLPESQQSHTT